MGQTPCFSRAIIGEPLFASSLTECYWPLRDGFSAVVHRGNAPQKDPDVEGQATPINILVACILQTLRFARCYSSVPF